MRSFIYALAAVAVTGVAASAEPITPSTITGYAASAAVARGVPLDGSANRYIDRQAPQLRQSAADDVASRDGVVRTSIHRNVRAD